jgi:TetR/AcrR family transcriptional regulator, regulator of autoinduction and epiphytic fitness
MTMKQDSNKPLTQSELKRQAIIEAALSEFQLKGFQAASMDAISSKANVSKRTVYNHFESKENLFDEIAKALLKDSAEMTHFEYSPDLPLTTQLMDFANKELAFLASEKHRETIRVMMAEYIRLPQMAQKIIADVNQQESSLERWISAAITDNRLKPVDPHYASNQLIGMIKANAFWPQILMDQPVPSTETAKKIATDAVTMFVAFYRLVED